MKILKTIKEALLAFPWAYLLFSLVLGAGGALFVLFPVDATGWVGRVLGGVTVLLFLFFAIAAWRAPGRGMGFFVRIGAYLLAIACGGYMLIAPDMTLSYLSIAVGAYALMDAGCKLQTAARAWHYRALLWWILAVVTALVAVGGVVLLRFPFEPFAEFIAENAVTLGIVMLLCGLQNFLSAFEAARIEACRRRELAEATTTVVIDAGAARAQAAAALRTESGATDEGAEG